MHDFTAAVACSADYMYGIYIVYILYIYTIYICTIYMGERLFESTVLISHG